MIVLQVYRIRTITQITYDYFGSFSGTVRDSISRLPQLEVEFTKALIAASNELTFIATFKQQGQNTGSIFSLTEGNSPYV